jgi:hypothetical protein
VFEPRPKESIESKDRDATQPPHLPEMGLESSISLILTDDEDIKAICTLVRGGKAKALMQVVFDPRGGGPQSGLVVSEISPMGWAALITHLGEIKIGRWRTN